MPRKTLTVFAVTLLVALAAMGIAYGLWTETLVINGTVHTGNLDVSFDPATVQATAIFYGPDGLPIGDVPAKAKDGVICKADVSPNGNTLIIAVDNAYPDWECKVQFGIKNYSTMPVKLHDVQKVDGPLWVDTDTGCRFGSGTMIDPGYTGGDCDIKIRFKLTDDVPSNQEFHFSFNVTADQWNEFR